MRNVVFCFAKLAGRSIVTRGQLPRPIFSKFRELKKMRIIRENKNGKIISCSDERAATYKSDAAKNDDVDLTIYEVVENATTKKLTLKDVT